MTIADDNRRLLAEIEDLIRNAPPNDKIHHNSPEILSWLGRSVAVLNDWHSSRGALARDYLRQIRMTSAYQIEEGYLSLITLLYEGRHVLQMATGTSGVALSQGMQFDYFDEIRKKIEEARQDIFFIDPYLDADFVSRYLVHVTQGVKVRLLTSKKMLSSLLAALKPFMQQHKVAVEVRITDGLHDRYFFVDGKNCYQSGASFKDGAKNAPTTITQITDVFGAVKTEYETRWAAATKQTF